MTILCKKKDSVRFVCFFPNWPNYQDRLDDRYSHTVHPTYTHVQTYVLYENFIF